MKKNVIAIEDEKRWLDNYKAWLSKEWNLECIDETQKAEKLLQERRFHVVLLDLAMSIYDQSERQNKDIQTYLASHPEGTRCIIVSAVANKHDTQAAYERYNAESVIFKPEIDPVILSEKVKKAWEKASQNNNELKALSRTILFGNVRGNNATILENQFIDKLNLKGGPARLREIFDIMLEQIYPIALHNESKRNSLTIHEEGGLLGLFWSRQLGHAVSIVLSKKDLPEADAIAKLDEWLGWAHGNESVYKNEVSNVRVQCFKENLSPEHFILPKIS